MQTIDSQKAVEIAANGLTTELRKTAFKLAAEVALPDKVLTDKKSWFLTGSKPSYRLTANLLKKRLKSLSHERD